jgi:hypothetical protein
LKLKTRWPPKPFPELQTAAHGGPNFHEDSRAVGLVDGVPLAGGETVTMQLAERGSQLSNKLWLREIRKLTDSGRQTSILTTNFFRYRREHYSLDRLIEYGTEPKLTLLQCCAAQFPHVDHLVRIAKSTDP